MRPIDSGAPDDASPDVSVEAIAGGDAGNDSAPDASAMQCPPGLTACSPDTCINLATSALDCGQCGHKCPDKGDVCSAGHCECPAGTLSCGGSCIDSETDDANCGACGNACTASGQSCIAGKCVCGGTTSLCGSACVDPNSDPKNCGACSHACAGTQCSGGVCAPIYLAGSQDRPTAIAVDASHVYWANVGTNPGTGSIVALSLSGGTPTTLASSLPGPFAIAVDSANIYWTDSNDGVNAMTLAGGTPKLLATIVSGAGPGIVVSQGNLYFNASGTNIDTIAVGGGAVTTVVSGRLQPSTIATDGTNLYWNDENGATNAGYVLQMPIAGAYAATQIRNVIADPAPGGGVSTHRT